MEVAVSEIKICRVPTVEGIKLRIKSTIWNTKGKEGKEFKKMGIGLGTSGTSLNVPTSKS